MHAAPCNHTLRPPGYALFPYYRDHPSLFLFQEQMYSCLIYRISVPRWRCSGAVTARPNIPAQTPQPSSQASKTQTGPKEGFSKPSVAPPALARYHGLAVRRVFFFLSFVHTPEALKPGEHARVRNAMLPRDCDVDSGSPPGDLRADGAHRSSW